MAIIIDLQMPNTKGMGSTISKLERAIDRLDKTVGKLNASLQQAANNASKLSGVMGGGGTSKAVRSGSKAPPQMFGSVQEHIAYLRQSADYRKQAQADRLQDRFNKSQMSPRMQALMRTRFSATGQAFPLGRDLLTVFGKVASGRSGAIARLGAGMLGQGALAGAAGSGAAAGMDGAAGAAAGGVAAGPFVAVAGALAAFAIACKLAVNSLSDFREKMVEWGGTPGQISQASIISRFSGVDPMSLQNRISGGLGMAGAQMAGINPIGGPFGDMNYSQKLVKAQKYVLGANNFEEARRRAAMLGSPGLANAFLLPPDKQKELFRLQRGPNKKEMEQSATADLEILLLQEKMERLKRSLAPLLHGINRLLEGLNNFFMGIQVVIDWIEDHFGGGKDKGKKDGAIKDNTRATQDLTNEIRNMKGTFGGGRRAQGALPGSIPGQFIGNDVIRDLKLSLI